MTPYSPNKFHTLFGYPFTAICGQNPMKLALILAAIDFNLGGVLLRGEKGTAKSTAARALASLLPPIEVVQDCLVGCDPKGPWCPFCRSLKGEKKTVKALTPFVDLPLGSTADRVLGSLDFEAAISRGKVKFSPGLLARAHRGILYIDEINLLPHHIAHLIIDAATSGQIVIERESISYQHPAEFSLIASLNPEEGPLGPQLTDRFGLCVDVIGEKDPALRREVLRRRLAYENDPKTFQRAWLEKEKELSRKIADAKANLLQVKVTEQTEIKAAKLASALQSEGQRGELALVRGARALAAYLGLSKTTPALVEEIAPMALVHRMKPQTQEHKQPTIRLSQNLPQEDSSDSPKLIKATDRLEESSSLETAGKERTLYVFEPGSVVPVSTRLPVKEGTSKNQLGRRKAREAANDRGRYVRSSPQRLGRPVALDATVRAAAPHQRKRRKKGGPALIVRKPDIREKVRIAKKGRLLLFLVDASGSMNAAARMRTTKAAILGLLTEAYQKRDKVGLVAFGGVSAKLLLPPTSSVEVAKRMLSDLPTGGKTPLAAGLVAVCEVLSKELAKDPRLTPLVVILTDGRPNVPLKAGQVNEKAGNKGGGWGDGWGDGGYADREVLDLAKTMAQDPRPNYVIVDTDTGSVHEINLCQPMAHYLGAKCVSLGKLTKDGVLDLVRENW